MAETTPDESRWRSKTAKYEILRDKDLMQALYARMTMKEMAAELHCNRMTIRTWLVWHGTKIRARQQHPPEAVGRDAASHRRQPHHWQPKSNFQRYQVSYWRQSILAERCPFMCPDYPCERTPERPIDGRSGCVMYNRLKNIGEFNPRPWEGSDPFDYREERLCKMRAMGVEIKDILDCPDDLDEPLTEEEEKGERQDDLVYQR